MTGATFGGPVTTGEPADGGPVTAGEPADGGPDTAGVPDVVPDADADLNEPDDVAQPMEVDDGEPIEGGSSIDEEPGTPWGSWHTQRRDTDSEVDRDLDIYVEDLDSDDSEYGSFFYASNSMPPVQDLPPGASNYTLNVSHFLNEESMSEPRILIYHEWLLAHEWHRLRCISDRVWCILQEFEPHSDATHEFPEVHSRPEPLINRIVFALAFIRGPNLSKLPGDRNGPNSAYLQWVVWGYFPENQGDWGPVTRTLPLNAIEKLHLLMTGILP